MAQKFDAENCYITPENDLICFILVMGIPIQPITEQLE
jgi:hypothetical protein